MIERWNPLFAVMRVTCKGNLEECSMFWIMLTVFPQTSNFRIEKLCCMSLKTTKQWWRWFSREEVPKWEMFPGPTELRLIGYSIESIWTPRSKSNTLTPRTNSQTHWQREISHVMSATIFCVCSTSAISAPSTASKAMSKRTQEESGEGRVTAKSRPMMSLIARAPSTLLSSASESPGKRSYESQSPLSMQAEKHDRTEKPVVCPQREARAQQFVTRDDETELDLSLGSR